MSQSVLQAFCAGGDVKGAAIDIKQANFDCPLRCAAPPKPAAALHTS